MESASRPARFPAQLHLSDGEQGDRPAHYRQLRRPLHRRATPPLCPSVAERAAGSAGTGVWLRGSLRSRRCCSEQMNFFGWRVTCPARVPVLVKLLHLDATAREAGEHLEFTAEC